DVTREDLDPKLRHLAENGYQTATAADIACYARGELKLRPRVVALCFDDAWKSVATVAAPLLGQYGLTAITYAIPGSVSDAGVSPFATWSELRALHASGVIDVQSHTYSHSMIFASSQPVDWVRPEFEKTP